LNDLNRKKEIRDEEIAMLRREIDIEVQEMDNEKEQLQQIKEDLRKELIKNTQCISNLNSVKDKQPTVQQQQQNP
jgi:chlorite dismutase